MHKNLFFLLSLTTGIFGSEIIPEKSNEALRIKTLNNMGTEHLGIDLFSQYYIDRCLNTSESVLEIASGFGHISKAVLKRGAQNVYVNDLCPEHLESFRGEMSAHYESFFHLIPGEFPDVTAPLAASQFHSIFSSRFFLFCSPEKLEAIRDEIYRLLKPGGQFILVTETAYLKKSKPVLIEEYEARKERGDQYPGYFPDVKTRFPGLVNYGPDVLHCLEPETLALLFPESQFHIIMNQFINRFDYPDALRLDGRESVGLIAVKK